MQVPLLILVLVYQVKGQAFCDHFDIATFTRCQKDAAIAINSAFEGDDQDGVCGGVKNLLKCEEESACKENSKGSFFAMSSHLNSLPQRNSVCIKNFIKNHVQFSNDVIGTCGNSEFKKLNKCLTEKFEEAVLNRSNKGALCNALKEVMNCQMSNSQCKNEYIGLAHMLASTPGLKSVSEEKNLYCLKYFIRQNTKVLSSGSDQATISSITVIVLLFSLQLQN